MGKSDSETSVYKINRPGDYPEESILHSEHGECLKSNVNLFVKYRQIFIRCVTYFFFFSEYKSKLIFFTSIEENLGIVILNLLTRELGILYFTKFLCPVLI
jgi:hypothetical protein